MKQSLQLRMGQQLTMTPQLQQAIKLLQLSTLDLQQEIQQALDSNMMLELADEESSETENLAIEQPLFNKSNANEISSAGSQTDMPEELPVDTNWEDIYEEALVISMQSQIENDEDNTDFSIFYSKNESLQEHLLWQLNLIPCSDKDRSIAIAIIDAINTDGYLTCTVEDIYTGLIEQIYELDFDEVKAVLHMVQSFDPVGVAALDLADCLALQLSQLPDSNPCKTTAIELVKNHLDLLANCEHTKLNKLLHVNEKQLEKIIGLIRILNRRPGLKLQNVDSEYVIPDVFVFKQQGTWQVNLNPDATPKLRVNPYYASLIKRADNSADNNRMKDHLHEAKWFIKSLQGRCETLLRVAQSIVAKQTAFLEHGAIAMKPMVLRDIAEELELHESTISRVTTQKYMHTPQGIIEFKYFFSSHVSTANGGECSATAIRAFIKELIANELPKKPLSDDKIANLLQEKGINVARRTVTKYREAMSIASSSHRKRLS